MTPCSNTYPLGIPASEFKFKTNPLTCTFGELSDLCDMMSRHQLIKLHSHLKYIDDYIELSIPQKILYKMLQSKLELY